MRAGAQGYGRSSSSATRHCSTLPHEAPNEVKGETKAIQDAIKQKKMDPNIDRQIIDDVLDSENRGHVMGVGRVVPGMGSSSRSSQVDQGFCTREEIEKMKKQHTMELDEQRNLFKQFMDFYNRQQGTPASQFQMPDS
ncbi:hypothetical protein CTI12_AA146190 [Artemisia annua]|uniref:Uncharacterized protein n=1 Tax=Artemisia annua TaxID=35608 RepID=A0A2U1PJE9_ARTAN|nr:hypothetical protein CTI12_AA146190 [Artemisia annua]